jgi:Fur family ferric uptake transcriptional regulator
VLRSHGQRWTGEREAVLEAVVAHSGHFSVDGLVRELQERGVAASRATVYRAMPMLIEAGLVQPTGLAGEERRYESSVGIEHHDHLVCRRCSKVVEFHFEAFEILQRAIAEKHGFELIGHVHELIGYCADCRAEEAAQRAPTGVGIK